MGNVIKLFFPQKIYDRLRDNLVVSKKSVQDFVFEQVQTLCVKGRQIIDTDTITLEMSINGMTIPQQIKLPDITEYQLDFDPNWKPQIEIKYSLVEINSGENTTLFLKAFCAAVNYLKNQEAHKLKEAKKLRIEQYKKDEKTIQQTKNMEKGFDELIKAKTTKFDSMDVILQDNILPEINRKLDESIKLSIQKEYQEIKNK